MNPAWRTRTVVGICRKMLDERDFSTLPILADALEEAGCDDTEILIGCREVFRHEDDKERLVNLIYSVSTEEAVRRIEKFAEYLGPGGYPDGLDPLDYRTLVGTARKYAKGEDDAPFGRGSMNWSNETMDGEGQKTHQQFWKDFQLVTGIDPPKERGFDYPESFFDCAC
jgi:hypothetical protein